MKRLFFLVMFSIVPFFVYAEADVDAYPVPADFAEDEVSETGDTESSNQELQALLKKSTNMELQAFVKALQGISSTGYDYGVATTQYNKHNSDFSYYYETYITKKFLKHVGDKSVTDESMKEAEKNAKTSLYQMLKISEKNTLSNLRYFTQSNSQIQEYFFGKRDSDYYGYSDISLYPTAGVFESKITIPQTTSIKNSKKIDGLYLGIVTSNKADAECYSYYCSDSTLSAKLPTIIFPSEDISGITFKSVKAGEEIVFTAADYMPEGTENALIGVRLYFKSGNVYYTPTYFVNINFSKNPQFLKEKIRNAIGYDYDYNDTFRNSIETRLAQSRMKMTSTQFLVLIEKLQEATNSVERKNKESQEATMALITSEENFNLHKEKLRQSFKMDTNIQTFKSILTEYSNITTPDAFLDSYESIFEQFENKTSVQ